MIYVYVLYVLSGPTSEAQTIIKGVVFDELIAEALCDQPPELVDEDWFYERVPLLVAPETREGRLV